MLSKPPFVIERMPVPQEKNVELVCQTPLPGFVTSLCYNLFLVLICTVYGFKTRMLPDNFNESRYITLCVYTTLVIWLAFLPTYFTTSRAYYQLILISSALLFNATVTLLCLYAPRIYALRREDSNMAVANSNQFKYSSQGTHSMLMNNRLDPVGQAEEHATELSDCTC